MTPSEIMVATFVIGLANHRLAVLLTADDITDPIREAIGRRAASKPGGFRLLATILSCAHCTGLWTGLFLLVVYFLPYGIYLVLLLALCGLQIFLFDQTYE